MCSLAAQPRGTASSPANHGLAASACPLARRLAKTLKDGMLGGAGTDSDTTNSRSRKTNASDHYPSRPVPGTTSKVRYRRSDERTQYAPTAARSCCHPSTHHQTTRWRTPLCQPHDAVQNQPFANAMSQCAHVKFGTDWDTAEIAHDRLSNTFPGIASSFS
jgi:hypothetical protein